MSPFTGRQANIDWDKLRIFHGVAQAGSLTRASERMGLSQSALSRQIAALEEALQTPLFHRHARGLSLTEAGEMLYRTAHEMDHRLTAARTRLMDAKDKPYGPLRVTATVGLGSIWLTPRLKEFIELYPDIQVSLLLFNEELDLARGEADVAIRLRQPVQPDLIQRKLFTVHNHIYALPVWIFIIIPVKILTMPVLTARNIIFYSWRIYSAQPWFILLNRIPCSPWLLPNSVRLLR